MKFAVRDDDTCYFTTPEDLKRAYGEMWGKIPISLAVIPFIKARKTHFIPKEYWNSGKEYPIGENDELVSFLRKEIKKGNVSIMLHGYNHDYYPKPEFVVGKNLVEKVKIGKMYLEDVFNVEIKTFVPPSNSLSAEGFKAVKEAGLNLLYYPTPLGRPFGFKKWLVFLDDLAFKFKERDCSVLKFVTNCYRFWIGRDRDVYMPVKPFVFKIDGIREFNCVSLVEKTPLENIIKNLNLANKYDGCFCLAVHYHGLKKRILCYKFRSIVNYIQNFKNIIFIHIDDIFNFCKKS